MESVKVVWKENAIFAVYTVYLLNSIDMFYLHLSVSIVFSFYGFVLYDIDIGYIGGICYVWWTFFDSIKIILIQSTSALLRYVILYINVYLLIDCMFCFKWILSAFENVLFVFSHIYAL